MVKLLVLLAGCSGLAAVDSSGPARSGTIETQCPEDAQSGSFAVPYGSIVQLWKCRDGDCTADLVAMTEGWEVVIPCYSPRDLYILTWIEADPLAAR